MTMKPIETRYKGYRFRSRLEARWAVFFDAMGIHWEFEPEGYRDAHGRCYLPDFKLAGNRYVEIKPNYHGEPFDETLATLRAARQKWNGFLAANPRFELMVFFGPPVPQDAGIPGNVFLSGGGVQLVRLLECRRCSAAAWVDHGLIGERDTTEPIGYELRCGCEADRWPVWGDRIRDAVNASRSARFEHGESGPG